jgi:hypothetical protein
MEVLKKVEIKNKTELIGFKHKIIKTEEHKVKK